MPASPAPEQPASSPYEHVLGPAMEALHPRLRTYFSAIPAGSEGRGAGVFDTVGTPHRWLWPLWGAAGLLGIAFPGWFHAVPFSVRNSPDLAGPLPAVRAVRTFAFRSGRRRMVDRISVDGRSGLLQDELGRGGIVGSTFAASVDGGALALRSRSVWVRVGPVRVVLPRAVAPSIALLERFDDERGQQHVDVTLDLPLIGRVYEYSGFFDYRITPVKAPGAAPADAAD